MGRVPHRRRPRSAVLVTSFVRTYREPPLPSLTWRAGLGWRSPNDLYAALTAH